MVVKLSTRPLCSERGSPLTSADARAVDDGVAFDASHLDARPMVFGLAHIWDTQKSYSLTPFYIRRPKNHPNMLGGESPGGGRRPTPRIFASPRENGLVVHSPPLPSCTEPQKKRLTQLSGALDHHRRWPSSSAALYRSNARCHAPLASRGAIGSKAGKMAFSWAQGRKLRGGFLLGFPFTPFPKRPTN